MNPTVLPPDVRLDEWPSKSADAPTESLTVAQLQGELRKCMPETVELLDSMKDVRQIQELVASLAAPIQGKLVMSTTAVASQREPALSAAADSESTPHRSSFPTS